MLETATLGYLMFSNFTDRLIVCIMGILVSAYALNIELKQAKNPKYRAYCDINDKMSCTRVLCSEYGKGFGIVGLLIGKEHYLNMPNCLLGIFFYTLQILLGFSSSGLAVNLAYFTSVLSCLGSVYLAVVLFFVLKDLCLVCVATYILNAGLFYLNYSLYSVS